MSLVRDSSAQTFARCLAAGVLNIVLIRLFNGPLAALNEPVLPWWRDVTTCADVAAFLALFILARRAPSRLRPRSVSALVGAACLVGAVLSFAAVLRGGATLLAVGAALGSPCSSWGTVVWLLACSTLGTRRACVCIAASGIAALPLSLAVEGLTSPLVLGALDLSCSLAAMLLCLKPTKPVFMRQGCMGEARSNRAVRPEAFLPLSHAFFVFIFVFALAYGFALRLGVDGGGLSPLVPTSAVQLAVLLYALRSRELPRVDVLFLASLALVVVGLMLALMGDPRASALSTVVVLGGYAAFELLMWLALLAAASRNTADAVPKLCWGLAVEYAGVFAGVLLWFLPGWLSWGLPSSAGLLRDVVVVVLVVALMFLALLTRRSFDFDSTIEGIAPDAPEVEVVVVDELVPLCEAAAAHFGLTAREADVMGMLARGHNSAHVQGELGIGANTVKFHAKNVYAKMGVHSQQELIDLVRRRGEG